MNIELKLNDLRLTEIMEFIKKFKGGHVSVMDLVRN